MGVKKRYLVICLMLLLMIIGGVAASEDTSDDAVKTSGDNATLAVENEIVEEDNLALDGGSDPEEIESRLCNFPLVSECVVVSRAAKIVSIIYPNPDLTKGMSSEQIETELAEYQKQINSEMPAYMQINKIQVRDQEFEKTPKKSIKRYLYE